MEMYTFSASDNDKEEKKNRKGGWKRVREGGEGERGKRGKERRKEYKRPKGKENEKKKGKKKRTECQESLSEEMTFKQKTLWAIGG